MMAFSRDMTGWRGAVIATAILIVTPAHAHAHAQEDHSQHHPPPTASESAEHETDAQHSQHRETTSSDARDAPSEPREGETSETDHAAMDHGTHGGNAMSESPEQQEVDHAAMGHGEAMLPRTPIPFLTDADRAAVYSADEDHTVHDNGIHYFVLLDRLEVWDADEGTGAAWEAQSWIGTDINRLWLRTEGEQVDGTVETGDLEVLYGRSVATWWDVVGGIRQDFGEDASQTFAAFGVQGLAPYKFEVAATAYFGEGGQTSARLEAEYDTLFTNRLILQWRAEADFYGEEDARRGIGRGLNTVEAGLRLRYEVRREFAPYIGVVWERSYGDAADFRRELGEDVDDTRVVAGVRFWF